MKRSLTIILIIALIHNGCGYGQTPAADNWCHLWCGLKMVYGDTDTAVSKYHELKSVYPRSGSMWHVFHEFNEDPDLELCEYRKGDFTLSEIEQWLLSGYRVSIYLRSDSPSGWHIKWVTDISHCGGDIEFVSVAGYF